MRDSDDDVYDSPLIEGEAFGRVRTIGDALSRLPAKPFTKALRPSIEKDRLDIESQTAAFLAKGGQIEEVEYGVSNLDLATGLPKHKLRVLKHNWEQAAKATNRRLGHSSKRGQSAFNYSDASSVAMLREDEDESD